MTQREIAFRDLPHLAPDLLADKSVVVLVPYDRLDPWCATVAWTVARTLAAARNVALVDGCIDRPALDAGAEAVGDEGLVDAFEFGSSLSRVARHQGKNLHYISAGTSPSDPLTIWASARWQRLQRGFSTQGAALLLFLPPEAVPFLTIRPDAMLLLARDGAATSPLADQALAVVRLSAPVPDRTSAPVPEAAALEGPATPVEGPPLPEAERPSEPTAPDTLQPSAPRSPARSAPRPSPVGSHAAARRSSARHARPSAPVRPRPPRSRARWIVLGGAGAALATAAVYWFVLRTDGPAAPTPATAVADPIQPPTTAADSDATAVQPPADSLLAAPPPPPSAAGPVVEPDTLFYSLQVAAFDAAAPAVAQVDTLTEAGYLAFVTPVRIGSPARMWHRVMVGAFGTAQGARSTRTALWEAGLVRRNQGTILRTPRTLEVGVFTVHDEARTAVSGLREEGVPGYIVAGPGGVFQLLVGAFEAPGQAEDAASLLLAAGYRGTLVSRIGIAR